MKITMYELLGMVKDGKAPNKIKVTGTIYEYDEEYGFYFNKTKNGRVALGGKLNEINLIYNFNSENIVEIIEEEKKIPEKLENEHEFYSYAKYEENKNEIDKVLYILKAINLVEEKIGNLNNSINEIIDYLDYLKSKGE